MLWEARDFGSSQTERLESNESLGGSDSIDVWNVGGGVWCVPGIWVVENQRFEHARDVSIYVF
jgi:hypothetical protein